MPFAINSNSGKIRVNDPRALDFETQPFFRIRVQVVDPFGLRASDHDYDQPQRHP